MSFKETEVGRIPREWNVEVMEDVLESIIDYRGKTPPKSDTGIKTLSAKSVKDGYIDYDSAYHISNETYEKFMVRGIPKKGDILMTTEAPLGLVAKLDRDNVAIAQRLLTLRGDKSKLINDYLMYYLKSRIGQHELNIRASGTTVLGIKQSEFRKVSIVLPPIEEQKSIAKILSDLDNKIDVNNKINQKLEDMAQSIFKHWFVDFEFSNEEGNPYKSSGGEMVESELGMIPKGWEVKELNEIFTFKKGKKPKEISEAKENENYKKYLTIDVLNQNSELFANTEKVVECDDDDVLMVMDGASSGAIFTGMSGIVGSTLSKLEVKNNILKSFVFQSLKFREADIKSHLTGSAIPHADKNYIYAQKVALPNDTDLLNILTKTFRLSMNKIRLNNIETNKLKITRDTLLPKLMSGEIRVPLDK